MGILTKDVCFRESTLLEGVAPDERSYPDTGIHNLMFVFTLQAYVRFVHRGSGNRLEMLSVAFQVLYVCPVARCLPVSTWVT